MLRLNKKAMEEGEVAHLKDVGDGRFVESRMPVDAVQVLLLTACEVTEDGRPGFEVGVDGVDFFPKEAFEKAPEEQDQKPVQKPPAKD